jgi:surface carbohydrate biosynthesis protein
MSKFLYMPIEIASRELDSRLLIALFAVNYGVEVFTGQKWLLQKNARWMPKGLWIFKTLTTGDTKQMRRIKKLGHRIAAIDEEIPGLGESEEQLRWVDKNAVDTAETIFCLGEQHYSVLKTAFPNKTDSLIVTGNPRWDLLRKELRILSKTQADKITSELGRIILINTNSGWVNSGKTTYEGHVRAFVRDGRIDPKLKKDINFVNDRKEFETANLNATAPLVKRIASEFPDHTIVLRPHPTEKIDYYEDLLAGIPKVKIIREGSVVSWLLASEILIHTSCTTASEAFALGKPAICYETEPSPFHRYLLSGALSKIAKNEDHVVSSIQSILAGDPEDNNAEKSKEKFEHFFASQTGKFAADKIALHVADSAPTHDMGYIPKWKPRLFFRRRWRPSAHQRRMFPRMSASELRDRLGVLAALLEGLPVPKVEEIGDGQFRIFS